MLFTFYQYPSTFFFLTHGKRKNKQKGYIAKYIFLKEKCVRVNKKKRARDFLSSLLFIILPPIFPFFFFRVFFFDLLYIYICKRAKEKRAHWTINFIYLFGYLVDPASSDMLISKIKPCKSKFKRSLR